MNIREGVELCLRLDYHLAPVGILMMAVTATALGVPVGEVLGGFVALSGLVIGLYTIDRLNPDTADVVNQARRSTLVCRHSAILTVVAVGGLLLYGSLLGGWILIAVDGVEWTVLAVVSGLLPVATQWQYDQIKQSRVFDSLVIGFVWAFEVVYLTALFGGYWTISGSLVGLFALWMCVVAVGAETKNIGDIEGDRLTGNRTIASVHGASAVRAVELVIKTTSSLVLVGLYSVRSGLLYVLVLGLLKLAPCFRKHQFDD